MKSGEEPDAYTPEAWRRRLWELIDSYRLGGNWPLSCRSRIKHHLEKLPTRSTSSDLMAAVESILEDGHMNAEQLARLRAAWEAA